MQNRINLLYELRPALAGFSGIPQESRLLFKLFSEAEAKIHLTGLINHSSAVLSKGSKPGYKYNQENLYKRFNILSKHIVSHYENSDRYELLKLNEQIINYIKLQLNNIIGKSEMLYTFNAEGFEDFIWDAHFSETLDAEDYNLVTSQKFKILEKPWDLFHKVGKDLGNLSRYPKINTKEFDILIAQTPFPGRVSKNTQLVIRYHDNIPIFHPQTINKPIVHRSAHFSALTNNVKNNAHFVCTSNSVKDELTSVFPQVENRTKVINDIISPSYYPENNVDNTAITEIVRRHSTTENERNFRILSEKEEFYDEVIDKNNFEYILMVSTIEPRKNHKCLIEAWQTFLLNNTRSIKLILVGELGWGYDSLIGLIETCKCRGQLFHLTNVPASEMRQLYSRAKVTVCPSIAEGFDLSGVEAMLCHCPVIASRIPVHQEIYSDAAIYFNPHSPQECTSKLTKIFHINDYERNKITKKGINVANRYESKKIKAHWVDYFKELKE